MTLIRFSRDYSLKKKGLLIASKGPTSVGRGCVSIKRWQKIPPTDSAAAPPPPPLQSAWALASAVLRPSDLAKGVNSLRMQTEQVEKGRGLP